MHRTLASGCAAIHSLPVTDVAWRSDPKFDSIIRNRKGLIINRMSIRIRQLWTEYSTTSYTYLVPVAGDAEAAGDAGDAGDAESSTSPSGFF